MGELAALVTSEQIATWLVIRVLIGYFVYKEWPEFKERMTSGTQKEFRSEQSDKQVNEKLCEIEQSLTSINEKMQRDYDRLNRLELELKRYQQSDQDSLEEREIIMRSLLGIIEGLQEMGANGPTKAAQAEITEYLNRKSHRFDDNK